MKNVLVYFGLVVTVIATSLLLTPQTAEAEVSYCETCSNGECIPVRDDFGFKDCEPAHWDVLIWRDPFTGETHAMPWYFACSATDSCELAPPS